MNVARGAQMDWSGVLNLWSARLATFSQHGLWPYLIFWLVFFLLSSYCLSLHCLTDFLISPLTRPHFAWTHSFGTMQVYSSVSSKPRLFSHFIFPGYARLLIYCHPVYYKVKEVSAISPISKSTADQVNYLAQTLWQQCSMTMINQSFRETPEPEQQEC